MIANRLDKQILRRVWMGDLIKGFRRAPLPRIYSWSHRWRLTLGIWWICQWHRDLVYPRLRTRICWLCVRRTRSKCSRSDSHTSFIPGKHPPWVPLSVLTIRNSLSLSSQWQAEGGVPCHSIPLLELSLHCIRVLPHALKYSFDFIKFCP